jgi:hypothetical protein
MMASQFLTSFRKRVSGKVSDTETSGNENFSNDPAENKEILGLHRLYSQEGTRVGVDISAGLSSRVAGANAASLRDKVDIVAIHGLGGTPFKTWTHENGKLWLRDFVPAQFSRARIYTFGYDSGVLFSKGTGTLDDFARIFLKAIKLERQTPEVSAVILNV